MNNMSNLIHITDLTHTVFSICKKHWREFGNVLVWLLIPGVLAALLPLVPLSEAVEDTILWALLVVSALISLWLSVVLIDMFLYYTGAKPHIRKRGEREQGLFGRIIDLILISIIQGIAVGIWFLLWIIPAILVNTSGLDVATKSFLWVLPLGLILAIPGAIFWNWFSFARYTVLVDGSTPGSRALRASKQLVRGRFWPIAWRWLGSYLYFGSLLLLGTLAIIAVIGALTGTLNTVFTSPEPIWWADLIETVIAIISTPLFLGVGVLLYQNAKQTK